jgi:antirestriction protein ArdC
MSVPPDRPARDIYQEVADRIIAALEQGVAPWAPGYECAAGLPYNGVTGRPYSGINVLLLWLTSIERGYTSPEWYTYLQACQAVGLTKDAHARWTREPGKGVRPGEHGTMITFWKTIIVEDAESHEPKTVPVLRHYTVFNRAQIDGLQNDSSAPPRSVPQRIAAADALVRRNGAQVVEDSGVPVYDWSADIIRMPRRARYFTSEGYYVDLLHELVHWTGHAARLARPHGTRFGTPEYAREELVAEIGSAFLCATLDITGTLRHAEYVGSWVRVLRDDKRAIFTAAAQARRAVDFLTDITGVTAEDEHAADAAKSPASRVTEVVP